METSLLPSAPRAPRSLPAALLICSLGCLAAILALFAPAPAVAQQVLQYHPDGSISWIQGELAVARLPGIPEEPDEEFYEQTYLALEAALRGALGEYFGATGDEALELASMSVRQLQGAPIGNLLIHQSMSGLPVTNSALRARVDLDTGVIGDIHGRVYPWKEEYDLGAIEQIPFEEAFALALTELGIEGEALEDPEWVFAGGRPQLVLAYRVLVSLGTGGAPELLSISASDGRVLGLEPTELTAPPTGPGSSSPVWPPITASQGLRTYDQVLASSSLLCSTNLHFPIPGYLSLPISACTPDASGARAHDHAIQVYRFYREEEGWKSYDGQASTLNSIVNDPGAQAHWDRVTKRVHYGDGDGFYFNDFTLGFDVAAHEISHGVTQKRNGLVYEREPGALNEAFSDIFAAAAEYWKDGGITSGTFLVGEDVVGFGLAPALRYMHDPSLDGKSPDYYPERRCPSTNCIPKGGPLNPLDCSGSTNDYCGVHYNSGIANLAFYLLVTGGTHPHGKTTVVVPGIGMEKARSIFFEAHGNLTPQSNFHGLRIAAEQAAADLYDAATVDAVSKCWSAVGVDP